MYRLQENLIPSGYFKYICMKKIQLQALSAKIQQTRVLVNKDGISG